MSPLRLFLFPLALLCLLVPGPLEAQFFGVPSKAEPDLVADITAVVPGKTFTVGIRFKIADKWHLYWRFPGDSGAPPSVRWELPPGVEAGAIQWPLPHALRSDGDLFTNVYEKELLLPVEFRTTSTLAAPSITIKAALKWYVCSETCLPGEEEVSLTLPVARDVTPEPANAELFSLWRSRLPKTGEAPPFQATWTRLDNALEIALRGIPPGQAVELFPIPPEQAVAEHPVRSEEDGTTRFRVPSPDKPLNPGKWSALIVLQAADGSRRGWEVSETLGAASASAAGESPGKTALETNPSASAPLLDNPVGQGGGSPHGGSFAAVLWTAFLGGLIMNLMPCVLPVIALKLFNFTRQAGEDPRRVFRLGLSFCAGVMVFFLGLAFALIGFQKAGSSLNWGFQFQNPWILLGLLCAVFVFGMNLLGVFEITLSSGASEKLSALSSKEGHAGAFLHGVFTTLLGTSCTAPYLGVTLGFAASQPAPRVVAIFLTIAAGMSLPYLLLTANPALLRMLPKPGLWMERLKQIMGFGILGVAVWLLGVVGDTRGVDAVQGACVLLLALGMGCWMFGSMRSRSLALGMGFLLAGIAAWIFVMPAFRDVGGAKQENRGNSPTPAVSAGEWQEFSPERLEGELRAGRPVFVDFTASWCLTCKANKKLVLSRDDVLDAFRSRGVVLLRADWSNGDPVITKELHNHKRLGVPLNVLYTPGQDPVRFPEILTPQTLFEAIRPLPAR